MRGVLVSALLAVAGAIIAPVARAAPLLTMEYAVGSLSQALQFMADGSVLLACDGSVLVACDGSVIPVPNASFRSVDGSVQELSPLRLLADGSVILAADGSVTPADDFIDIEMLSFSPNPFLAMSFSATDFGVPSTFVVSLMGPLNLGANAFDFELTGHATLTDAASDGVSVDAVQLAGFDEFGLVFGSIDYGSLLDRVRLPTLGAAGLSGAGGFDLGSAAGFESCAVCATQTLGVGFTGSGGGDQFLISGRLDLSAATAVPAPAPLGLLALGLLGIAVRGRRRT